MELHIKCDELSIRCPLLGGEVTYKYCITMDKKGCPSIPVCFNPATRKSQPVEAGYDSAPGREHIRKFSKGAPTKKSGGLHR